jgi:Rod binding domain-containing protein
MLDGELAKEASGGEGIGIADLLYRQLSQNKDR